MVVDALTPLGCRVVKELLEVIKSVVGATPFGAEVAGWFSFWAENPKFSAWSEVIPFAAKGAVMFWLAWEILLEDWLAAAIAAAICGLFMFMFISSTAFKTSAVHGVRLPSVFVVFMNPLSRSWNGREWEMSHGGLELTFRVKSRSAESKLMLLNMVGDWFREDESLSIERPAEVGNVKDWGTKPFWSSPSWLWLSLLLASLNLSSKGLTARHFWIISAVEGTSKANLIFRSYTFEINCIFNLIYRTLDQNSYCDYRVLNRYLSICINDLTFSLVTSFWNNFWFLLVNQ